MFLRLCFCGGAVVVVWWCFCCGVVVFLRFSLCGGVLVVLFLWWCFCGEKYWRREFLDKCCRRGLEESVAEKYWIGKKRCGVEKCWKRKKKDVV